MRLPLTALLTTLLLTVATASFSWYKVNGFSMYPLIVGGDVVVVDESFPFDQLKQNDIVVYSLDGVKICHKLHTLHNDKWKAKGINNRFQDRSFVTSSTYIGKVIYVNGKKL
jgi:signal peptidase I